MLLLTNRSTIAHSIREQLCFYRKAWTLAGDLKSLDPEIQSHLVTSLRSCLRDSDTVDRFTPTLHELTEIELEKLEQSREREAR